MKAKTMTDIPNIADIIASYRNQDNSLHMPTADPAAVILEIDREKLYYGEHKRRMTELKKIAALQKTVLHRILERNLDKHDTPKRPHLTVVK